MSSNTTELWVTDPDHLPDVEYARQRNFIRPASPADLVAAVSKLEGAKVRNLCREHHARYNDGAPGCEVWMAAREGGASPSACQVEPFLLVPLGVADKEDTEMSDIYVRMGEAWPRLADGLFDFLADIDVPGETLADLDVATRACRLLAEGRDLFYCQSHQATSWNPSGCWVDMMGPELCRLVLARLVVTEGTE